MERCPLKVRCPPAYTYPFPRDSNFQANQRQVGPWVAI
jgi:hypothetical protein